MFGQYQAHTLILDEAHNAFDSISELFTKYVYRSEEDYGDINTIGETLIYLEKQQARIAIQLDLLRKSKGDAEDIAALAKELRHNTMMASGVQNSPKDFFFEKRMVMYRGKETEALRLQPTTLNSLSGMLFSKCC